MIKKLVCSSCLPRRVLRSIGSFVLFNCLLGCQRDLEPGSKGAPLQFLLVPSDDTQKIAHNAESIALYLEKVISQKLYGKDEGFYIKAAVPNSYVAVIEAFGTGRADVAGLGTFDYVLTKDIKKYPIEAVLNLVRGENETTYKAAILARTDSNINSLKDLAGKKFAYVDPASAAGYILPALLFAEQHIQLGQTVFAGRHDNVVTMLYQRQVEGGAVYFSPPKDGKIRDARSKVLTQYPDVEKKIKIIGFTRSIPNAPWVMRTTLFKDRTKYEAVKTAFQDGLIAFAKTDEGKKILAEIYSITGFVKATDDDYAEIRKVFVNSHAQLQSVISQKK